MNDFGNLFVLARDSSYFLTCILTCFFERNAFNMHRMAQQALIQEFVKEISNQGVFMHLPAYIGERGNMQSGCDILSF